MTKLKQKITEMLKTMNSCRYTTESSVKATNGSGMSLHKDYGTA